MQQPRDNRAMRSDRLVVECRLVKVECERCGLVRDASLQSATPFDYRDEYQLDFGDHIFHSDSGKRRRSAVFADWIAEALNAAGTTRPPGKILEIGSGRGYLVNALASRWTDSVCEGIELNRDAAAEAVAHGINVRQCDTAALPDRQYDVVIAIAVVEHVPSPTSFIGEIRRLLKTGGTAVLIQPTQDVPSYDVFFVDHLHHFATAHLGGYAAKCGFHERYVRVGFDFMPNFSAHAWSLTDRPGEWHWHGAPAATSCAEALATVLGDLRRVDEQLAELLRSGRRFGVFGLHEVFALARAYSSIERGIAVGLDDDPGKPEYRAYPFPVMRPEDAVATGVRDVFMTMNRLYYGQAGQRLTALGMTPHPVLS